MTEKQLTTMKEWEEKLENEAKNAYDEELKSSSVQTLSTKNKKFSLGEDILGESMCVVIAGSTYEHAYYDRPYDPDVVSPPACFAIGDNEKELAPHPDSPDPQANTCSECEWDEFGSAIVGKGKRCRNGRRLGLFAYDSVHGLSTDQMVILKLAPTSLKPYSRYVKAISMQLKKPPHAVITDMSFNPDTQHPVVLHKLNKAIDNVAELVEINGQLEAVHEELMTPYNVEEYEPPKEYTKSAKKSKMS